MLETIDDIRRFAMLIDRQTVQTRAMPLGNETGMTEAERRTLGVWLRQNR